MGQRHPAAFRRRLAMVLLVASLVPVPSPSVRNGKALAQSGTARPPDSAQAESPRLLFQRAVHFEEAMGQPGLAIDAYEAVIASPDAEPTIAAVAQLRLALLLSRVGRRAEALQHHLRITERYADDPRLEEIVMLSRAALGGDLPATGRSEMVARRLWEGSQAYGYGSLAPDGSFISFVDLASGNLAIHDLDRGSQRYVSDVSSALENDALTSSVVSPDGRRIAYTWYSPDSGFEVRLIGADGAGGRTLLSGWDRPRHVELESWSASGNALLAVVYVDESTHELALISLRDGSIRTVAELGATPPELARLSPDGRWIVYHQADEDGNHDLFLAATDSSAMHKLIDHPANDLLPIWTSDGRSVLFVSDRTGALGAWVVHIGEDGQRRGEPQLVKPDFGRSIPMGFTAYGSLIYAQQVSLNDIYTATYDQETGTLGERVAIGGRFVGMNRSPAMSPDGQRMVYLSERGLLPADLGPKELVVREIETNKEHSPSPPLRRVLAPRWHPDSQRLIAEALDKRGRWGIFTIDSDSGGVNSLVRWDRDVCACSARPVVSPDGAFLGYFRPGMYDADGALVVRNLETGNERRLIEGIAPRDLAAAAFSPDTKTIAVALRHRDDDGQGEWMLELVRLSDGRRQVVASLGSNPEVLDVVGWAQDGSGVTFVRADEDRHSLGWASANGAQVLILVDELPRDLREIRIHPRYDRLVFTGGEYRAEIWMLENPLAALADER